MSKISFLHIQTLDEARAWIQEQQEVGWMRGENLAMLDRKLANSHPDGVSQELSDLAESLGIEIVGYGR